MNIESERLGKNIPSIRSLIILSIGLIIVAILTSAFVYAETATVDVGGASHDIQYVGTGVTVSGITADTDFISLVLNVDVSETPGTLEITLDRSFFDSTFQGSDDNFIVLADGDEPKFSEIQTNSQSRTLSIELPAGTQEVEIIGSQFGSEPTTPVETPTEEPTTPVETPTEEPTTPVETPTEEPTTPVETPTTEKPKTECGTGTILKDGVCVLDERCGSGTILKDGVCVAEPVTETTSPKGSGTQLVMGIAISFVIAGVIGLVLALMSKASKSKN